MYTAQRERRNIAAVTAAVGIAFFMIAFKLAIQFVNPLHAFLIRYTEFPVLRVLIDFLFVWLAVLLWVALRRWRSSERARADLDAVLSSINPDALLVVSPDRTIRMCNDAVERIFGRRPQEVVGRKTDLLYHDRRTNPDRPREIFEVLARRGFHYGLAQIGRAHV